MQPIPVNPSLFPYAVLQPISQVEANVCLISWDHRMGPVSRPPEYGLWCHALVVNGDAIALTVATTLIRDHVGGGLQHLDRFHTLELTRVCAYRPDLCRAMIRLWRELVFPAFTQQDRFSVAISYQDAVNHRGDLYRFDGWARSPERSRSGTDQRSGKKGIDKWIWVWPPTAVMA